MNFYHKDVLIRECLSCLNIFLSQNTMNHPFFLSPLFQAIALSAYVLMTETFDAAHRELPTIAMQFFWAMGIMTMALLGYLIPRWQDLELTIALPINVLSLVFALWVDESYLTLVYSSLCSYLFINWILVFVLFRSFLFMQSMNERYIAYVLVPFICDILRQGVC